MSACWLAIALALAAWPPASRVEHRLRALVGMSRLAGPARVDRRPRALFVPSARVALGAGALIGAVVGLASSVALGVAASIAAMTALDLAGRSLHRRSAERDAAATGDAVRVLVAELESGAPPATALAAAAGMGGWCAAGFSQAAEAAAHGADVAGALAVLDGRGGDLSLGHAWRAAATGAPLAAVLARVDADLDARRMQNRDVSAALAGPRSSAVLLAGLPLVGLALGTAMGARPLTILLSTPAGQLLLCAGVLLDAAGVLWTLRLTAAAESP